MILIDGVFQLIIKGTNIKFEGDYDFIGTILIQGPVTYNNLVFGYRQVLD